MDIGRGNPGCFGVRDGDQMHWTVWTVEQKSSREINRMDHYLKIIGGVILVTMGVCWLLKKIQDADYKDTPISTPKLIFSAILSIVLGLMLIWETFSD